jgi:outer membrane murein-binding lipoprotein Lpp
MGVAGLSGSSSTWKKDKTSITIQFVNGKVALKNFTKN